MTSTGTLEPELLHKMNAYWRAANYLSVAQIYLYANPLLRRPLALSDVKPLVVGHSGTTPGQNFIYVHLNRAIMKYAMADKLVEHTLYIDTHGQDHPDIRNWTWNANRPGHAAKPSQHPFPARESEASGTRIRGLDVIVIVGLIVLLVAVIVAVTGVLANAGPGHPLTGNFAVLGYHVTGSTGTLFVFVFGIVVGAVAMLGLGVLLAGARRTAGRGRDVRLELRRSQRESAFLNRDRDLLLEHNSAPAEMTARR